MNSNTVYDVTIFGIDLAVKPVAFTIPIGEGWDIYWYGIIISIGFLAALLYGFRNAARFQLDVDRMIDVVLVATPVAIVFARVYYLLFDGVKVTSFRDIVDIHNGGLAIYGGIIGAFAAGIVMSKIRKVNTLALFDLASLGFLLAQGIGRWGNFVNQEVYGKETGSTFWGMTSNRIQQELYTDALVHPLFLYESLWCILGFILLHIYSKKRKVKWNGEIFLGYAVWYGFGRFFNELLRAEDYQLKIGTLPVSVLVSALVFVAGLVLLILFRNKATRAELDTQEYAPIFGELEEELSEEIPDEGEEDEQPEAGDDTEPADLNAESEDTADTEEISQDESEEERDE